jgi:hypothetical protein
VLKTVNQDDPSSYRLFYGDAIRAWRERISDAGLGPSLVVDRHCFASLHGRGPAVPRPGQGPACHGGRATLGSPRLPVGTSPTENEGLFPDQKA